MAGTMPGASSQTYFMTCFRWSLKRQILDLEEEGLCPELLDSGSTEIYASE
jgi:F-box protein 27